MPLLRKQQQQQQQALVPRGTLIVILISLLFFQVCLVENDFGGRGSNKKLRASAQSFCKSKNKNY